jgi:glycosyltransferase involved in cell wall biosynthesis
MTPNMPGPMVSVIMSVYGARYLRDSVNSVLTQTFGNFEFVIVDDGSTDDTWSILSAYATRDARLVLLRNDNNIGYTRSLNRGLGAARGTLIARQDADDISMPERLARQVAFLEANPEVGLVASQIRVIDADGNPVKQEMFTGPLDNDGIQQQLLEHCCLCHGSVMFRRTCLDAVGFYDEGLEPAEDYDLWLRIAEVTRLAKLPDKLFCYRRHADSVSFKRPADQQLHQAGIFEKTYRRRFGANLGPEYRSKLGLEFFQAAILLYLAERARAAADILDRALDYDPGLLDSVEPLEQFLAVFRKLLPATPPIEFCESLFAHLLRGQPAAERLKPRVLSRLHMREVFQGLHEGDASRIDRHLWSGLRFGPSWLINRGVLAVAARSLLRQARHSLWQKRQQWPV